METNSITQIEALSLEDLRRKEADLRIKMSTAHHMQEAMLLMSMKTNPKTEQNKRTVLKREIQKEMQDIPHPEKEINQEKRRGYPVENANKTPTQICLGVQTLKSTYQENQMGQIAFPRKYAGYA